MQVDLLGSYKGFLFISFKHFHLDLECLIYFISATQWKIAI